MTNSLAVEIWGIRDGLTLEISIAIINIYVESDSKDAIGLIVEEVTMIDH